MNSILEHEPELIHGIGLITVRWSALEHSLASVLNQLLKVPAGLSTYYSLSNFSQRIDMVERLLLESLNQPRDRKIVVALFGKVKRLWKARNYLVHSDYAYVLTDANGKQHAMYGGRNLGQHPSEALLRDNATGTLLPVRERGFAYISYSRTGLEYVRVNKGTYQNHADQLAKRSRQLERLWLAIQKGRAPLVPFPSDHKSLGLWLQSHLEAQANQEH